MLSKGLGDPQESIDHTVRSAVLANSGQVRLRENEEWVLARSGDLLPLWILVELQSVGKPWAVIRGEDILGRTWHLHLAKACLVLRGPCLLYTSPSPRDKF